MCLLRLIRGFLFCSAAVLNVVYSTSLVERQRLCQHSKQAFSYLVPRVSQASQSHTLWQHYCKASKKISNGCGDVQHTGLQSTQTRRNTGKQGARTCTNKGHSAHLPKHHYISGCTACLTTKQFFFIFL